MHSDQFIVHFLDETGSARCCLGPGADCMSWYPTFANLLSCDITNNVEWPLRLF